MSNIPKRITDAIIEVDVEGCWASVMHILRNEDQPYPDDEKKAILDVALNLANLSDQAIRYAIGLLTDDTYSEHPEYHREDWAYEVWNRDTQLGYWQWVFHQLQSKGDEHAEVSRDTNGG